MRFLPDNPSIDFLRREAKDLLAAMRESSSCTLADAQRALAEQYGFRTWPDLKAEVERRRTDVPAADPALADGIAAAFGLGRVTGPMTPQSFHHMGRTWQLSTDRGRWLVGPVFDWMGPDQLEPAYRLLDAAREAGIATPDPVRSRNGTFVERVDGRPWHVQHWMELGPAPATPVRSSIAAAVGGTLATLHGLALPTDAGINPYLTYRRPIGEWEELEVRARANGHDWASRFEAVRAVVTDLDRISIGNPPAPLILCGHALMPEAVRIGRAGTVVVIGWEYAGADVPAWELASTLVHWAYGPEGLHEPSARAIADGYRRVAGSLPALDRSSFGTAVAGWLNYFHGELCEAIGDRSETAEARRLADQQVTSLLANPLSTARVDALLETIGAGVSA